MELALLREKVHRARVRLAALDLLCSVTEKMPRHSINPEMERKILLISRRLLKNDDA